MSRKIIYSASFLIVAISFFIFLRNKEALSETNLIANTAISTSTAIQVTPIKLFFVGDIMLSRDVETRIIKEGIIYPFKYSASRIEDADVAIANFEGIVNEKHIKTPSTGFQFSIRNEYLSYLKHVGFDVLSLANNHSYDYGKQALKYTRSICSTLLMHCVGSPIAVDEFSYDVLSINEHRIGLLFIQSVISKPDINTLETYSAELVKTSDIQIAYIHWGDEYESVHTTSQEKLAHFLIDNGFDVIIGHHPHVIQDIEIYKGKPIFYSLGNFIFDQYFSAEVQNGLGIELLIADSRLVYTVIPFTSINSKNQPHEMNSEDSKVMYLQLLENITNYADVNVSEGTISFPRNSND